MQEVTHWDTAMRIDEITRKGLPAGSWVMIGGRTFRNWILSGSPQQKYALKNAVTAKIPSRALKWPKWPKGWEWIKGFLGHRILIEDVAATLWRRCP
jgi:hypothetical protein